MAIVGHIVVALDAGNAKDQARVSGRMLRGKCLEGVRVAAVGNHLEKLLELVGLVDKSKTVISREW